MAGIFETASDAVSDTIFETILKHTERWPNRPAIVTPGFKPLTFADLMNLVGDIWESLSAGGVSPGARIGICLPSGVESIVTIVATTSHATCVPLNPNLSEHEFALRLANLDLDALIIPAWLTSSALAAAQNCSFGLFAAAKFSGRLSDFSLECLRSRRDARDDAAKISSHSTALILSTSATTGPPKLVPVTNGNMLDLAGKMAGWFGLSPDDRAACVLPTYYAAGVKLNILAPLLLGEGIAVPVSIRPERLPHWVSDLRPTWFSAGPTFLQAVLDGLKSGEESLPRHTLRFITAGAAHLPSQLRCELEAILDCPILEVYGISEAGVMAANPAPPAKRKPGTAGLIARGELEIRDPAGKRLPPGSAGEIHVSGPGVMPGYLNGSENEVALQDGWLRTGDIGLVDADGFLTILGRTKEVINRGGEKISPYEIESTLLLHPSVSEAAAFPVPHPRLGENVAAAVVLKPDATATPDELGSFLRGRIASFKIPQHIDIVASLPKGHTGKILRTQLAQVLRKSDRKIDVPTTPLEVQIAEIWRRLLKRSDIGVNDNFFEAGGDSLLATEMILEVEAAIRRSVPHSAIVPTFSIRQIADMIAQDCASDTPVTKIKSGNGTPFFFCHGDFNTRGFYALKLAELMKTDRPIYLIHPPNTIEETFLIEATARRYVSHLLKIRPVGSISLGGHCNGGLLAWEIAHQLEKAGREVESVTLIDVLSLNARNLFRAIYGVLRFRCSTRTSEVKLKHFCRNDMAKFWNVARKEDWNAASQEGHGLSWLRFVNSIFSPLRVRIRLAWQLFAILVGSADRDPSGLSLVPLMAGQSYIRDPRYFIAMSNYVPGKLQCKVNVIVCKSNANAFCFAPEAWGNLAGNVRHASAPGEHLTCITIHAETLAQTMNTLLSWK